MASDNCVKLLLKLRQLIGVKPYGMMKRMGVSQTAYKAMEEKADTLRSDRLWRAWEIARDEANIDAATFFLDWFANDAKAVIAKKAKEKT